MDGTVRVEELPARRGAAWLTESFRVFRGAPLQWLGLCAGWISITLALVVIPFLGLIIASFLQPVFFASFAIAAYKQLAGERIVMADLFAGFRRQVRYLVNLGALELLAEIAIFGITALMGLPMVGDSAGNFDLADYLEALRGKEWLLALYFLLTVIVKGALWFAPALIAFHGMPTMHAVRWSIYAALANLGAMVVYGVLLVALLFVATVPSGLGLIVALPMMAISTYLGYRDVFENRGQTTFSKA